MSMIVITVTKGMRLAITVPVRNPRNTNMTARTMAMAWIKLLTKSAILVSM